MCEWLGIGNKLDEPQMIDNEVILKRYVFLLSLFCGIPATLKIVHALNPDSAQSSLFAFSASNDIEILEKVKSTISAPVALHAE